MRYLRIALAFAALALLPGCVVSATTGTVYGGYARPYYGPPPGYGYYRPRPYGYGPYGYGPPRGYGYYRPRPYGYGPPPGHWRRGW